MLIPLIPNPALLLPNHRPLTEQTRHHDSWSCCQRRWMWHHLQVPGWFLRTFCHLGRVWSDDQPVKECLTAALPRTFFSNQNLILIRAKQVSTCCLRAKKERFTKQAINSEYVPWVSSISPSLPWIPLHRQSHWVSYFRRNQSTEIPAKPKEICKLRSEMTGLNLVKQ